MAFRQCLSVLPLFMALGCAAGAPAVVGGEPKTTSTKPPTARPPIVVALVVDQLAQWVYDARVSDGTLAADSRGFGRLPHHVRARYTYAATDTAPGHATLFTGALPAVHGIFANEWPNSSAEHAGLSSILFDGSARPITTEGIGTGTSSSAARFLVPTVADRLHAVRPAAPIVALSLKDRATIAAAGRTPTLALWWDPQRARWVSSSALTERLPAWVGEVASPAKIDALLMQSWVELVPGSDVDAAAGEGDLGGYGTVFPHRCAAAKVPGGAFRASPFADEMLVDLAIGAVDHAPYATEGGLLAISFSTNDYLGHLFGPESREARDGLRRLDRQLARLFDALDARFGAGGYEVVLSADHGVEPLPERRGTKMQNARIDPRVLGDQLAATVADPWILPRKPLVTAAERTRFEASFEAARAAFPIAHIYAPEELAHCTESSTVPRSVCDSAAKAPIAAGAYYLLPMPGAFVDTLYVPGFGTSHGTDTANNQEVPLLTTLAVEGSAGNSPSPTIYATLLARALRLPPL
jgi:hypothetical protein